MDDANDGSNHDEQVELVSDGDGLAVIGSAAAVEQFMAESGLVPAEQTADDRGLTRALTLGSTVTELASKQAENSGRWLKLTKESAENIRKLGGLTPTKTPGISHAMIGRPGASKKWIQIVDGPKSALANPVNLANLGGLMSQMAMQQQLDEISDYLERIDEKLDDLIRTQENQLLARVDAVGLAIAEAMTIREKTGRVSEVAWSKVQDQSTTILETQAFALRQLADLVRKFERKSKVADLAEVANEIQDEITSWLSLLARCFQLHDAHSLLELDRVMDASPEELDQHRMGIQAARRDRIELFKNATQRVLDELNAAARTANSKVLFHPRQSPALVDSRNFVATHVIEFHEVIGIEAGDQVDEAKRWRDAALEKVNQARDTGTQGLGAAKRLGIGSLRRASSVRDRIAEEVAERRSRGGEGSPPTEDAELQHPADDASQNGTETTA